MSAETSELIALLVSSGVLAGDEGRRLLRDAERTSEAPVRLLHDTGAVSGPRVLAALRSALGIDVVAVDGDGPGEVEIDALRLLPRDLAERHVVLPLRLSRGGKESSLVLAMADPLSGAAVQTVEEATGYRVEPVLAEVGALIECIERQYARISTRLIQRPDEPAPGWVRSPDTTPNHRIMGRPPATVVIRALSNLLVARGVLAEGELEREVARLMEQDEGE